MNVLRLDSVVFETPDVARARRFYVDTLGLHVGTYIKDGATVADEDEKYFNLDLGGSLLGFEHGETQSGTPQEPQGAVKPANGTIVLMVDDLTAALDELAAKHIAPQRKAANFAIIADPDGREIILQA
ncbi:MAG: VOC family protein [Planctomycetes bacterium]|nr:VOC family protein [Planctomycetota bacterium]